jgi:hypothetical protein
VGWPDDVDWPDGAGVQAASNAARQHTKARIGRSLHLGRGVAAVGVKTPFQTVRADFPHTAYRRSLGAQHYAASFQKGCSG